MKEIIILTLVLAYTVKTFQAGRLRKQNAELREMKRLREVRNEYYSDTKEHYIDEKC